MSVDGRLNRRVLQFDAWTRFPVSVRRRYAVAFLLISVGFPAFYLTQALHVDESVYLVVGQHVADGSVLYVDIIDHKPPAIFYLAAGASVLVEQPHVLLRLLTYAVVAVTGLLVLRLGTYLFGATVGMAASLLYLLGSYLPHFDGFAFMTEQYVALCTVVAASLFLQRRSVRTDVGVGLALGVGVLFNQATFLFGAVVVTYVTAVVLTAPRDTRWRTSRDAIGRLLAIGAGFAVPTGLVLAYFVAIGAFAALVEHSLVVPLLRYDPPFSAVGHLYMTLSYVPLWVLALLGVLVAGRSLVVDKRADEVLFVAIWTLFLSYPGMTQFAGDHKLLYVFPPAALLGATTLQWLWHEADFGETLDYSALRSTIADGDTRSRLAAVGLALVAVLAVGAGGFNVIYGAMVLDSRVSDQQATAAGVASLADGEVYTFPFALDLVYFGEGVESPPMYPSQVYTPEMAEQVVATLEDRQVRYVVVSTQYVENDAVVGHGYFADSERIVAEYVTMNYEAVGTSDGYVVFERVDVESST